MTSSPVPTTPPEAASSREKQIEELKNQQPKAKRIERNIINTKIGRMKDAERKRKGEEHSRGNKR